MTSLHRSLISVIVPSYNHAPFVAEALGSVLGQTVSGLEVIVVDDGSTDGTPERVRQIADDRLRLIALETNTGACNAMNVGIAEARGEFVAVLNSDDRWRPNKLAVQLAAFESEPALAAVFTNARFVNQQGAAIPVSELGVRAGIFSQPNRPRTQWLRRFFLNGNCLCHPSLLMRRRIYDELGPYDNRYRQLPDFHMWIRLCKRYDLHVCGEELVDFRLLDGEANTSGRTQITRTRACNEHLLIAEGFFDGLDDEDFKAGFRDLFIKPDASSPVELAIEKAFLYFAAESALREVYAPAGFQALYGLLAGPESRRTLSDSYGFGDLQFHEYMSRISLRVEKP